MYRYTNRIIIELSFFNNLITGGDGTFEGFASPMVDLGTLYQKYGYEDTSSMRYTQKFQSYPEEFKRYLFPVEATHKNYEDKE